MVKVTSRWYLLIGILITQCVVILWYRPRLVSKLKLRDEKYVGLHLNYGRLGNQLFHIVTGYGIARTLGRIHYLPPETPISHVRKYLDIFEKAFPQLRQTYVLSMNDTNGTVVPFAGSCCTYDNPCRLLNHSAKYLLLDFSYGQNPRYFEKYLPEIRDALQFSDNVRREGKHHMDILDLDGASMLCIHIRVTDFAPLNISTDANRTAEAANIIARQQGVSRFMIFGDDQTFMYQLSEMIVNNGNWKKDAVVVSNLNEVMDMYLASEVCHSFLITASTSTFGWWLAFFTRNQDAVFYIPDDRQKADNIPSTEHLLTSWKQFEA